MKRNITVDYVYRFLSSFDITSAIWVLFLGYKGMSLIEIGLLESIYHTCNLIFEIPTGAMADLLGRRRVIILSRVASVISCLIMLNSHSFWGFGIGFIFSAFGGNLNSGSEEALVYDSLIEENAVDSYLKLNSRLNVLIEIAQAMAVFIGGILAEYSFELSYSVALLVSVTAFFTSLQFKEPQIQAQHQEKQVSVVIHFKNSFRIIKENSLLTTLLLYFPLVFTFGTVLYFYGQQFFADLGYSKIQISMIFLLNGLFSALGALFSEKMNRLMKGKAWIYVPLMMSLCIIGFGHLRGLLAIITFILLNFLNASLYPISSLFINELTPSEQRATIISVSSMFFSLMMILIFPLCGLLGQLLTLSQSFIIIGFLNLGIILIIFTWHQSKNRT